MVDDDTTSSADPDVNTEIPGKPSSPELSDRIGSYRILEQLGEGGFAVVYLAEYIMGLSPRRKTPRLGTGC